MSSAGTKPTIGFDLRPWQESDADWYVAARDEEIFRWTTEPRTLGVGAFLEALAGLDGSERAGFAVAETGSIRLVGNVAAVRRGDVAELSYWIAPEGRGRGAATAALARMSEWVVDNWDVSRLELLIHPENAASIRVAERSGYAAGGTRRSCLSCAEPDGTVAVYLRRANPVS